MVNIRVCVSEELWAEYRPSIYSHFFCLWYTSGESSIPVLKSVDIIKSDRSEKAKL